MEERRKVVSRSHQGFGDLKSVTYNLKIQSILSMHAQHPYNNKGLSEYVSKSVQEFFCLCVLTTPGPNRDLASYPVTYQIK